MRILPYILSTFPDPIQLLLRCHRTVPVGNVYLSMTLAWRPWYTAQHHSTTGSFLFPDGVFTVIRSPVLVNPSLPRLHKETR